jgi:membrane protein implicated in regulation of membrane protease activity
MRFPPDTVGEVGALGVLDLGIDLKVWPWIWLVIAVAFALIELTVLAGSFVLLPFAVSAFVASILGFYDVPVEIQWIVFVVGGAAMFIGLYRWSRRFADDHAIPPGVGADRLVGMIGVVTAPILPDDSARRGRVVVAGEPWGALTDAAGPLAEGARVRIIAMRGTRVVVEAVDVHASDREQESS